MSDTGFIPAIPHAPKYIVSKTSPVIVRVVDNTPERSLQKLKVKTVAVDDLEDDVFTDVYDTMVEQAAVEYLAKQIEELNAKEGNENDVEGGNPDPEVELLLSNVFSDDGEYVKEPILDPDMTRKLEEGVFVNADKAHSIGEVIMKSDDEDIFEGEEPYDSLDPVEVFAVEPKYIAKANEENMKDEPYTGKTPKWAQGDARISHLKQTRGLQGDFAPSPDIENEDEEHGDLVKEIVETVGRPDSLRYMKNVEGRVLTIMEAAIPDKEQRNAIKTLIKKEFRREMSKVGREVESDED